ncbi:MAG: phosphate ABC transporter permease subunit PstC [Anaerolinea sp.]|nr:phosphate ABC transporter permease subunit PstC [Anaerolinea sp.]
MDLQATQPQPTDQRAAGKILASRQRTERRASVLFKGLTLFPILIFLVILVVLIARSLPILQQKSLTDLLFGQIWRPSEGVFGFLPFIAGSLWVTGIAILLAAPVSILCAIFLSEYAKPVVRTTIKPLIDILAAIPSVVYGLWGVLVIVPWVGDSFAPFVESTLGFLPFLQSKNPTGYSILSGAIVLAVMVTPFIIAISYEVMRTVPRGYHEASLAVGATRWQTVRYVIFPRVASGLAAGVVLGISRAFGETMAVLMVVGNNPNIPKSILDAAYPLPALIANNYGEMMSIPLYDAALLGSALLLLIIVLIFNVLATLVLRKVTGKGQE